MFLLKRRNDFNTGGIQYFIYLDYVSFEHEVVCEISLKNTALQIPVQCLYPFTLL